MNKLNCPNCGAPISGSACEYCGTVFRKKKTIKLYADGQVIEEIEIEEDDPE